MARRLYRSTTDVIVAGVCGGLGKALGTDPAFVRLFFVLGVWSGLSLLIYPLLWVIVPREDRIEATTEETIETGVTEIAEQAGSLGARVRTHSRNSALAAIIFGCLLVLAGISALTDNMLLTLSFVNYDFTGPLVLVAIGFILIQRKVKTA